LPKLCKNKSGTFFETQCSLGLIRQTLTLGQFTWITLSLRLWLSRQDQPSRFSFGVSERFAETKLPTERSLNPKLINSQVDFTHTHNLYSF